MLDVYITLGVSDDQAKPRLHQRLQRRIDRVGNYVIRQFNQETAPAVQRESGRVTKGRLKIFRSQVYLATEIQLRCVWTEGMHSPQFSLAANGIKSELHV